MKTTLIWAALAAACLGGCQTVQSPSTVPQAAGTLAGATTGALPAATAKQVQSIASRSCSFVPTLATIANIFASGNPVLTTATSIANAICGAIAAAPAGNGLGLLDGGGPPAVGDVLLHGTFKDGRKI